MDRTVFNKFRKIVYETSGIALADSKEALVSARVGKRLRALDIPDTRTYLKYVEQDQTGEEVVHLLDVISTNVTNFFRENDHFEFLSDRMEEWLAKGQRSFKFWSAACSTGEEPYSLAMTLCKAAGAKGLDIRILATDISTRVLKFAREGIYDKRKMKDVPLSTINRYFNQHREGKHTFYEVKDPIRNMVVFRRLNLSTPPFPMKGPFDMIFCRNVMIYFDNPVRQKLLSDLHRLLKPGAYLMVGHAESLTGMVSDFKPVKPSIYVRQ